MKLSILKPDGSSVETNLSERQPSLDSANNELLFFENYIYKLIIRGIDLADHVELFVGDYSIPLAFNDQTECYETNKELIFSGCFDLAYISIYVENEEVKGTAYYTEYLRIATTKQTAKQVEQMLSEIEEYLPNFLEICFSRNRKKSGVIKNDVRSIWNTLKIIGEIIKVYEESYSYFYNHKKASVEPIAAIVDAKSMRTIDQESLRWILCNPDNLIQTEKKIGIEYNGKKYLPTKVKTYLSQYSYEVYENKAVLGLLTNVISYVRNQIIGFNKEIDELENIPESIIVQIPNTHELTGRCVYIYYKGVINNFSDKLNALEELYFKYERALECSAEVLYGIPKLTNTFKQIYHYRLCYECMIKWFEAGDYLFDHLNYLFKLKTLSRIFEYYCLIKLQTAIIKCGYSIKDTNRIIYDMEDDVEDINNQYVFSDGEYELTLLYEPSIWVSRINDEMNLYSTGYNFSKGKWNNRWTPDFVLKVVGEHGEYYYVLDAKYSTFYNVKKLSMPELVLKYGSQIASKDKSFSDVIGVGAIYPGEEDKMSYFKKNDIYSQQCSLPHYFSLTIVGGNSGNVILGYRISELLKTIDDLERSNINEDLPPTDGFQYLKDDSSISDEKIEDDLKDHFKDTTREKDLITEEFDKNNTYEKYAKVIGKKCYYYGKGMCMQQRTRCTIVDESCEYFIPKNMKNLIKEEDTCRNFIKYTQRGKVTRIECSISGLPGCVGSEICKFCLVKNKSKK